jgi:hypothetical protein
MMFDQIELGGEFFEVLTTIDERIVKKAAAEGCVHCGGPLHRGDYPRKPRGGAIGALGAAFDSRFSLCCGREGCRKRATPPSVRFLGRRVYVGAAIVIASALAVLVTTAAEIRRKTGIAARTVRRWRAWWRGPFTKTAAFVAICARLVPAPTRSEMPHSILVRLRGSLSARVDKTLALLAPVTTSSVADGSRFVRAAM